MGTKIENGLIFNLYTPYRIYNDWEGQVYSKISQVLSRRDELSSLYKYSRCLFLQDLDNYLTNDTNTYYILIVADGETTAKLTNYGYLPYSIDSLNYIKLINKSVELGNNILDLSNDFVGSGSNHLKVKGILLSPGETVQIPIWYHYDDDEEYREYRECFMLECGGIPYFSKTV